MENNMFSENKMHAKNKSHESCLALFIVNFEQAVGHSC